jgi:hypothetical protein
MRAYLLIKENEKEKLDGYEEIKDKPAPAPKKAKAEKVKNDKCNTL